MFINEPEGKSFHELQKYLGAAAVMGTAIDIRTTKEHIANLHLNHTQSSLPDYIELFEMLDDHTKRIKKIRAPDIVWFKLKRHGRTESYVGEDGIPIAKLPIILLMTKEFSGTGKIINPGTTSIYAEEINFKGEISTYENNEKK